MLDYLAFLAPFIPLTLSGIWDIQLQIFFCSLVILIFSIVLIKGFLKKNIYIPYNYFSLIFAVIFLVISYSFSPVRNLIAFEFSSFIISILLLIISLNINNKIIPLALKISYFLIFVSTSISLLNILLPKAIFFKNAMTNPNTLAFASLLFMGITLENKNYILSFYLLIVLFLTKSLAGVSVFFILLFYYLWKKNINKKLLVSIYFLLALLFIIAFNPYSLLDRFRWWQETFRIFLDRALYGFGYSSYPFISPGYHIPSGVLSSTYAHNYFLEFMTENGIIASLFWFYFLFSLVLNSYGFYRYSLIGVLIHSFADFGFNTIGNFSLFLLISGISQKKKSILEFKNYKVVFAFLLIFFSLTFKWIFFSIENLKIANAIEKCEFFLTNGKKDISYEIISNYVRKFPENFDLNLRLANLTFEKAIYEKNKKLLFMAASQFEYVLILNPYYLPAYKKLKFIYLEVGEKKFLKELIEREKRYIKWKR